MTEATTRIEYGIRTREGDEWPDSAGNIYVAHRWLFAGTWATPEELQAAASRVSQHAAVIQRTHTETVTEPTPYTPPAPPLPTTPGSVVSALYRNSVRVIAARTADEDGIPWTFLSPREALLSSWACEENLSDVEILFDAGA